MKPATRIEPLPGAAGGPVPAVLASRLGPGDPPRAGRFAAADGRPPPMPDPERRLAGRLAVVAHGLIAVYLATLLGIDYVQTPTVALAWLVTLVAIAVGARDGYGARARQRDGANPGVGVFIGPALVWGLIIALQMITGKSPPNVGNQLAMVLCATTFGLCWIPAWLPDSRRWLLPAAAIGAIAAGLLAAWQAGVEGVFRPHGWLGASALGTGAIKFGDLATVLGLLSLVLVTTASGWRYGLGLVGIVGGATALALSQARGGLLGALIAVGLLMLGTSLGARRRAAGSTAAGAPIGAAAARASTGAHGAASRPRGRGRAMLVLAVLVIAVMAISMQARFAEIESQIERFQQGDALSEAGQRLALWQAAIRTGLHAPWTGVGFGDGFANDIARQVAAGQIPESIRILYSQPHNQYLGGLVAAGFPGFIVMVVLFWLPVVGVLRRLIGGADSAELRAALVVSAAFAGFALTDSMFDRQITIVAFFVLSAWFLRMAGRTAPVRPERR